MARRKTRKEQGAAAVEFALVLPLFLLLVLGTIDFGYYFFVSEVVTNAAREGARAGSVIDPSNTSLATSQAQSAAQLYLTNGGLKSAVATGTYTTTSVGSGATATPAVQVDLKYPVGSVTGFLSGLMPAYSNAHAVMRWQ
jgi:Flp pilus assembly protein TadG